LSFVVSNIPPDKEAWTALQASSLYASPFQSPEYYDFLKSQTNHQPIILTVHAPLSLLLIDLQSNTLRHLTSRAIIQGGPLIAPDCPPEALRLLIDEAIKLCRQRHAVYFEIRPYFDYSPYSDLFSSCGLSFVDYCDCIADTSSAAKIDRNIQPRKLTQIRSALRHGITFCDTPSDQQITEFYALLSRKHWQRTRRPIPPLRYFIDLAHTSIASILLAYHEGQLLSGCVALHDSHSTYYYYVAGHDTLYRHLAPSSVITYHFLHYSHQIGCPQASMMGAGRLSIPFGVRDFKLRMGSQVIPSGRYIHIIHPLIYRLANFALNLLHRSNT